MDQMQSNPEFANFLVAYGACSQDLANEMTQKSNYSWTPLGMILIESKKLRMRDVGQILTVQADNPTKLFGALAVELGLCEQADLEEAMIAQRGQCPNIFDLALEEEGVDQKKLMLAVREYIRSSERTLARMSEALFAPPPATGAPVRI